MKIGIVVGSIREGSLGAKIGRWVAEQAQSREVEYELINLKDFDLPLLTSPVLPMMANRDYADPRVEAWSGAIDGCDAYVLVTGEYNHGIPGAFKNAVDSLGPEWVGKAFAAVGYGATGGIRAIEQWRTILANFSMVGVRNELNFNIFTDFVDGEFVPAERLAGEAQALFDAVETMAHTLSPAAVGA